MEGGNLVKPERFTDYPEVGAVLAELLAGVRAILGELFGGMYLYGSLASGDFNPQTSDVDFLVTTLGELPAERVKGLEALHTRLASIGSKWAHKLEGVYVPVNALRRHDSQNQTPYPTLNEGDFYLAPLGSDWIIQRHILRQGGVVLAGPPPAQFIDPVGPEELRRAVRNLLKEWWEPAVWEAGFQAGAKARSLLSRRDYRAYAVLTMCRALYALQFGEIASKPFAARWALEALDPRWHDLIERSLAWAPGMPLEQREETLEIIRETLSRASASL